MYRTNAAGGHDVLLVHPGGPYWKNRDLGSWSIPKGEVNENEALLEAAIREFQEETGVPIPDGIQIGDGFVSLGAVRQKSGKKVHAWAMKGDCDAGQCRSIDSRMEFPPRSGRWIEFPEIDRAAWFTLEEARRRILPSQAPLLDSLAQAVSGQNGLAMG